MRSSVAFALISLNVACWTTIAAADDLTQGTSEKRGRIVATAPRHVDTTHGLSTAPDHVGAAVIANLRGTSTGATAGAIQPPALSATASFIGAGAVTVGGGNAANVATVKAGLPAASTVTVVSTVGVRIEPILRETAGVAASRTGTDRTGAVASFGSVQTATVRPMGTGAAAGNFTVVGVRPDATTQQSSVVAVGGVLSAAAAVSLKTGLTQGIEATNVRATALADVPSGGGRTGKPGGVTPRAVGIWNNATSMGDPAQRTKPVRHKR